MLIAFGSWKGGVGKTTIALTAAHMLARAGRPVLLVDADLAGTEVADLVPSPPRDTIGSLADALTYLPMLGAARPVAGAKAVAPTFEAWTRDSVVKPVKAFKATDETFAFPIMPSFPTSWSEEGRSALREAAERGGPFVGDRFQRLLQGLVDNKVNVVVDGPAFDVGFALLVHAAVRACKGEVLHVIGPDIRDILPVLLRFKKELLQPEHVVANRLQAGEVFEMYKRHRHIPVRPEPGLTLSQHFPDSPPITRMTGVPNGSASKRHLQDPFEVLDQNPDLAWLKAKLGIL